MNYINQFLMVLYPINLDDFSGFVFDLADSADSLRADPWHCSKCR